VCQVEHFFYEGGVSNKVNLLICLGEHEFFMMSVDMKEFKGEVSYPHILRVIKQLSGSTPEDVIVLELSEDRKDHIPAKVTFATPSKDKLLKHLKCYWQADYMFRLGIVRTLHIEEEVINMKGHRAAMNKIDIPKPFLRTYPHYKEVGIGSYGFFIPNGLQLTDKAYGTLQGTVIIDQNDASMNFQMSMNFVAEEERLVDAPQRSLKFKADLSLESYVDQQEYWVLRNEPYIKGLNLRQDIAAWQGWLVKAVTPTQFLIVIYLRRKFIPPLLETSQDIMIRGRANLDKDPEELLRKITDSIFSTQMLVNPYGKVIQAKANGLLMSEETANFLQSMRPIPFRPEPTMEKWAFLFVYSLAFLIKEYTDGANEMLAVTKMLDKLDYIKNSKPNVEVGRPFSSFIQDPMNAANMLCGLYPSQVDNETSEGEGRVVNALEKAIWDAKVARYLGYCVDGGLLFSRLTMADITGAIVSGAVRDAGVQETIKVALNFMLNIRQHNKIIEQTDLAQQIKLITDPQTDSQVCYMFNEKIMIAYMEQEYLQRELDFNGQSDRYLTFLEQLLTSGSNDLKAAACREVIRLSQGRAEESPLKASIGSLLNIYKRNDYMLATLAAFALVNLSRSGKEIKEQLFEAKDLLLEKLKSKEQMLLAQTIKIFNNIVTNQTYRVSLKDTLPLAVIKLMSPPQVDEENSPVIALVSTPVPVIDACMELLSVLTKDAKIRTLIIRDEEYFNPILHLLKTKPDCEIQVIGFIQKLCIKSVQARQLIYDKCIDHLIGRLSKLSIFSAKQSGRFVLQLISLLMENIPELKQKLNDANALAKLQKIIANIPNTDSGSAHYAKKIGYTLSN
jgi:hypothetical protein